MRTLLGLLLGSLVLAAPAPVRALAPLAGPGGAADTAGGPQIHPLPPGGGIGPLMPFLPGQPKWIALDADLAVLLMSIQGQPDEPFALLGRTDSSATATLSMSMTTVWSQVARNFGNIGNHESVDDVGGHDQDASRQMPRSFVGTMLIADESGAGHMRIFIDSILDPSLGMYGGIDDDGEAVMLEVGHSVAIDLSAEPLVTQMIGDGGLSLVFGRLLQGPESASVAGFMVHWSDPAPSFGVPPTQQALSAGRMPVEGPVSGNAGGCAPPSLGGFPGFVAGGNANNPCVSGDFDGFCGNCNQPKQRFNSDMSPGALADACAALTVAFADADDAFIATTTAAAQVLERTLKEECLDILMLIVEILNPIPIGGPSAYQCFQEANDAYTAAWTSACAELSNANETALLNFRAAVCVACFL